MRDAEWSQRTGRGAASPEDERNLNLDARNPFPTGGRPHKGVYGTQDFWWTLRDRYPLAKAFVTAFLAKNNYRPRWGAHIGYMQTYVWALAVERAGSFYPVDVIKALEASKVEPFDSTLGKVWYRAEDHQMVRPVPVCVGKAPSAMKNPDDFYDVVEVVPGEQVVPPADMFGCHLGAYS